VPASEDAIALVAPGPEASYSLGQEIQRAQDASRACYSATLDSGRRGGWKAAYADIAVHTVSLNIIVALHRPLSNRDGISRGEIADIPPK